MPNWLMAIIFFASAIILLRIAGKRTFSQMTPGEVVVMIGLGTVLVHPLKSERIWMDVYHGALIILLLLAVSFVQIIIPKTKKWLMGEPILLIRDGQILYNNLKKSRMPVDELKMRLRTKQINDIAKVKSASLEVGGELGLELYKQDSYATKQDIEEVINALNIIASEMNVKPVFYKAPSDPNNNLFNQIEKVQEKDPLQ